MRHRFHALCPYFAMFPESFAEKWIGDLTKPGDVVLDPFCGRGTAPFQALLMQRRSVGIDISPVAYCITGAKTNPPSLAATRRRLTTLERTFRSRSWRAQARRLPEFFAYAYSELTLAQVLFLRSRLDWRCSNTDRMLAALVLSVLHGETNRSSKYLSNQMPHVISTKPAYSVRYWQQRSFTAPMRNAFDLIRDRLTYRYESDLPQGDARVFQADMRGLPALKGQLHRQIRCVVTSPPYMDVTNFEEDQWLRNWFLGGPPYPTYTRLSLDNRHLNASTYWSLIADLWRSLAAVLAPRADVVIRIGAKRLSPESLSRMLHGTSGVASRKVTLVSRETSAIKRRQTETFRPGAEGCLVEVDCHFRMT